MALTVLVSVPRAMIVVVSAGCDTNEPGMPTIPVWTLELRIAELDTVSPS